jgi:hypothetical protein
MKRSYRIFRSAGWVAPALFAALLNPALPQEKRPDAKPPTKAQAKADAKPAAKKPTATKPVVKSPTVSGITFDLDYLGKGTGGDGVTYVLARPAAAALGWSLGSDGGKLSLNGKPLAKGSAAPLPNGSWVVPVRLLGDYGAKVSYQPGKGTTVSAGSRSFAVEMGKKRVVVDLAKQKMTAYQGGAVVLMSGISSGVDGKETPVGVYRATEYKDRDKKSIKYEQAPMPWAVQIKGDIFFHGYDEVERRPRSRGCVRLPMTGRNPARFLFHWITPGTPVEIIGKAKGT